MKTMTAAEFAALHAAEKAAGIITTMPPSTDIEVGGDWDIEEEDDA